MFDDDPPDELLAAQAAERAARRDVDDAAAVAATIAASRRAKQQHIARLQSELAAIEAQHAAQEATVAERERAHGEAEEALLDAHCATLAARIIAMNHADPLRNRHRVGKALEQLQRSVRSGFDTPINQNFTIDPLVTQALSLLPARDAMHVPLDEMGFGRATWPERRRKLLAAFEASENPEPLQAA